MQSGNKYKLRRMVFWFLRTRVQRGLSCNTYKMRSMRLWFFANARGLSNHKRNWCKIIQQRVSTATTITQQYHNNNNIRWITFNVSTTNSISKWLGFDQINKLVVVSCNPRAARESTICIIDFSHFALVSWPEWLHRESKHTPPFCDFTKPMQNISHTNLMTDLWQSRNRMSICVCGVCVWYEAAMLAKI